MTWNNSLKPTAYACHALCRIANPAPHYGSLAPPVTCIVWVVTLFQYIGTQDEISYLCFVMDRKQIDTTIINYLEPFKPERIGIFGSYAREEQTEDSDLDILVSFKETISLFDLVQIHQELSDLLGIKVDVVTEGALKNETLKKYIYQDLQMILNEE